MPVEHNKSPGDNPFQTKPHRNTQLDHDVQGRSLWKGKPAWQHNAAKQLLPCPVQGDSFLMIIFLRLHPLEGFSLDYS